MITENKECVELNFNLSKYYCVGQSSIKSQIAYEKKDWISIFLAKVSSPVGDEVSEVTVNVVS